MPGIHLHETSQQRVLALPDSDQASLYVCGITPYDATHMGHAATYVAFDLLNRAWRDAERTVTYVQNVTDIDDPLLERATRDGQDWRELAISQTALFHADMEALKVLAPEHYIGAVESIEWIVPEVQKLIEAGLAYPVAVTLAAQVVAPWQARGSLVTATGGHTTDPADAVGSALLGQVISGADLFLPRPSAAGDGYDPLSSAGSNLGPESPDLLAGIEQRRTEVAAREGVDPALVPPDAATASASGLDPQISPAYAALQVTRVAAAQGLTELEVRRLVTAHTSGRTVGVLGEPRVDVLALDLAVLAAARD